MTATTIHTFTDPPKGSALSEDQFQILVDLLTPVHELALLQLKMLGPGEPPSDEPQLNLDATDDPA